MRNLWIAVSFGLMFVVPIHGQDVYRVNEQVTQPTLREMSQPKYGEWNLKQLGGLVRMEIDVMPDGTVGTVALVKSAGAELDAVAVDAAKRIRFAPGTKDGKPVAVRLALDLRFDPRTNIPMRFSLVPQADSN